MAPTIPTTDTALLLIDVQNGFLHEEGLVARMAGGTLPESSAATIEPLIATVAAAREQGIPIIYTQHGWKPDFSDAGPLGDLLEAQTPGAALDDLRSLVAGSWEAEILDALAPAPEDHRLPKNRYDAFLGTPLAQLLTRLGVRNLVVAGLVTSCCVESTIRDAAMRDYRVWVVGDAVGDVDTEVHEQALARLGRMFAWPTTSAELTAAWAGERAAVA